MQILDTLMSPFKKKKEELKKLPKIAVDSAAQQAQNRIKKHKKQTEDLLKQLEK